MMKLARQVRCTKISAKFGFRWSSPPFPPWVRILKNVAFVYDIGKINAGCPVGYMIGDQNTAH